MSWENRAMPTANEDHGNKEITLGDNAAQRILKMQPNKDRNIIKREK